MTMNLGSGQGQMKWGHIVQDPSKFVGGHSVQYSICSANGIVGQVQIVVHPYVEILVV